MIGTPRPGARAFHQRYSAEWEAERKLLIADADLWLLETGQIDAATGTKQPATPGLSMNCAGTWTIRTIATAS